MRRFKCLSVDTTNMRHFTIGKIYETDNNMLNYRLDGGNMAEYCPLIEDGDVERGLVFEEIKEEGENKMEDLRELIKPCYLLILKDGKKVKTIETQDGIVVQYTYNGWDTLNTVINKIEKIYGFSNNGANVSEFSEEDRPLIYEKKSPTQLKLEELEKKQREIADEMEKLRKEL